MLSAIGLSGNVFAGFQRRATDALFPAAPTHASTADDLATIRARVVEATETASAAAAAFNDAENKQAELLTKIAALQASIDKTPQDAHLARYRK